MPRGDYSKFFCTSYSFFPTETSGKRKVGEITKSYFPKGKNKFFALIFVITILPMILYFFKHTETSEIRLIKKTKRHLTVTEIKDYQGEEVKAHNNVEIIPETRRIYRYPNHKYRDEETQEGSIGGLFSKRRESKTNKYPKNVQDIILQGKFSDPQVKEGHKFLNEMLKGSGSMRLRGIYKQSGLVGSLEGNYHYLDEINNLMQNGNGTKGEKRFTKNIIRSRGAPFQLPDRERESLRRQKPNFLLTEKSKMHPITIYLDFYPMNLEESRETKIISNGLTPSESKYPDAAAKESVNVKNHLPPRKKKNRMIMKLNLYPKELHKESRKPAEDPHHKYNEKAERKSLGCYSRRKRKRCHGKECSFTGLNSNEKYITAKWKNENGEWIHAKNVVVKYLKKIK